MPLISKFLNYFKFISQHRLDCVLSGMIGKKFVIAESVFVLWKVSSSASGSFIVENHHSPHLLPCPLLFYCSTVNFCCQPSSKLYSTSLISVSIRVLARRAANRLVPLVSPIWEGRRVKLNKVSTPGFRLQSDCNTSKPTWAPRIASGFCLNYGSLLLF